jgi:hypothetical protein
VGQKETAVTGKDRIMIYCPKNDGTYIVEFRIANGEALAISVPAGDADAYLGKPVIPGSVFGFGGSLLLSRVTSSSIFFL